MSYSYGDQPKRIVLHARLKDGRLLDAYTGAPLPDIKEDAVLEISTPAAALKDPSVAVRLGELRSRVFLPKGSRVLLRMAVKRLPKELLDQLEYGQYEPQLQPLAPFATVHLEEDLNIYMQGYKKPSLGSARCRIDQLPDAEVVSLNQAFTELSKKFQPERRSNTANVFGLAYIKFHDRWFRLDELREQVSEKHRKYLNGEVPADEPIPEEEEAMPMASQEADSTEMLTLEDMYIADAEEELLARYDIEAAKRRNNRYIGASGRCCICDTDLERCRVFVDGVIKGTSGWGNFCARCHASHGNGVGIGRGQVCLRLPDGKWIMVAGDR